MKKTKQTNKAQELNSSGHPKNQAAVELGRLGGLKKSPARAAASRRNGLLGGRPKKK